jgi:hypothetical protein
MKGFRQDSAWLAVSLAGLLALFGFSSCESVGNFVSTTQFSQSAYDTDKQLRDESLTLIAKAKSRTRYSKVAGKAEAFMQKIDDAIVTEKGRTKNAPTVAQWETIKSQLGHFFDLWKTKGTLSPAFIGEASNQVSTLFETLIRTEEDKRARR